MHAVPESYARAVEDGRYHDAATDAALRARWHQRKDTLARALLVLAAAHHHIQQGNPEGARLNFGRAVRYLEREPCDPYAARLIEHARQALAALQDGRAPPPLPLGFR